MNSTGIGASAAAGLHERVAGAIQLAAARSGVDFHYLLGQAQAESGLNPNAQARGSSATGLFQFLDQSWLGVMKAHGGENGYGWAASAIQQGGNGRYSVSDPSLRRQILDLRRDPTASAAMAASYASDNRDYLQARLGRSVNSTDLYMAHFLGSAGAAHFLRQADASPDSAAASAFPAEARANRAIFYNHDGSARSYAEVMQTMATRLGSHSAVTPSTTMTTDTFIPHAGSDALASLTSMDSVDPATVSPAYARLAYLMLAELGG